MNIPVIRGLIERRILVNYRVPPEVLTPLLPAPFRPQLHRGQAMVGICLIRLRDLRPGFLPAWMGLSSENAAHRAAVEWDDGGVTRHGVYVRRRDTNSWLSTMLGGRVFPGIHSHATFTVLESATHFEVALRSDDGATSLAVQGDVVADLPATSRFDSLAEASAFFEAGSLGYSATPDPQRFEGLELRCRGWKVEPLAVTSVHSSYFEDPRFFPPGSIEFDCALLMRGIDHEWHGKSDLCCSAVPAGPASAETGADSPAMV
jgi:uncharacterized protein DUF2071